MLSIKKILVPTDFSDTADFATEWALELAARVEAEVRLLNVYDYPSYALPDGALIPSSDVVADMLAEVETQLEARRVRFHERGVPVSFEARQGAAVDDIVAHAAEWSADLIVMGTHGRAGLGHLLLGSVAERVVRKSPCPVTTVRLPNSAKA